VAPADAGSPALPSSGGAVPQAAARVVQCQIHVSPLAA